MHPAGDLLLQDLRLGLPPGQLGLPGGDRSVERRDPARRGVDGRRTAPRRGGRPVSPRSVAVPALRPLSGGEVGGGTGEHVVQVLHAVLDVGELGGHATTNGATKRTAPIRGTANARPLSPLLEPITAPAQPARLDLPRPDRPGGTSTSKGRTDERYRALRRPRGVPSTMQPPGTGIILKLSSSS